MKTLTSSIENDIIVGLEKSLQFVQAKPSVSLLNEPYPPPDPNVLLLIPDEFTAVQSLSPREFQLLQLLATGIKTGQLARQLGLSAKTLDSYFCSIRAKLGVKNVWALRVLAARFVEWMEREKVERREVPERWSFRRVTADGDQPSDSREPSDLVKDSRQ